MQAVEVICESLEEKFALPGGARKSKSLNEHLAERVEQAARFLRVEWKARRAIFSQQAAIGSKSEVERCRKEFETILRRIDKTHELEAQQIIEKFNDLEPLPNLTGVNDSGMQKARLNEYWSKGDQLESSLLRFAETLRRPPRS